MTTEAIIPPEVNHAIPAELRERPQWKVSNEKNAGWGWNNPANLRTYDQACDHARKIGADRVIYIVLEDDPYTFVDLDGVRDPTSGYIDPWAQAIIDRLDSYTEASSSGRGVHVLVEAHTPGPRTQTNALPDFEIYTRSRPALITGDRLNDKGIEPRQSEIDDLYHEVFPPETPRDPVDVEPTNLADDEVLRLLTEVDRDAPKWRTTLGGDWGEHYTDQSGADFAIAGKLAFYSGDQEQVERLMNHSGLCRDKYDTMRGPITYLQQTIGRVFDKLDTTYTPPSNLRMTVGHSQGTNKPRKGLLAGRVRLGELIKRGITPTDQLIQGVIYAGRTHQIFCGPGKGKTFVALWAALRLIKRGLRVLYLDKENGENTVAERLKAMGASNEELDEYLCYVPFPTLDLAADAVQDYIDALEGFSLVIFDSWINYLAAAGLDENSNGDLARWSTVFCSEARKRNISVLLLDHVGKDSGNGSRGASRKLDEMDAAWELRTLVPFDRQQIGVIQLRRKKDRESWLAPTVEFEIGGDPFVMRRVDGYEVEEPDSVKNTLAAIEGFGADGARYADWMKATGAGRTQFTEARKTLIADGRVVKSGSTYYAAGFSPGAQPDLPGEHLVREPEPDLTGLVAETAQNGLGMVENRSGSATGLEEESSSQSSPVRATTLGVAGAGLVDRGTVDTNFDPIPYADDFRDALADGLIVTRTGAAGDRREIPLRQQVAVYHGQLTPAEVDAVVMEVTA